MKEQYGKYKEHLGNSGEEVGRSPHIDYL